VSLLPLLDGVAAVEQAADGRGPRHGSGLAACKLRRSAS
jgi:hypothetical protein